MGTAKAWRIAMLTLVLLSISWTALRSSPSSAAVDGSLASLVVHVTDGAGHPIVARVRVAPVSWSERARLRLWSDPHALSDQTLSLSPGQYEVFVTRGPEWSLVRMPYTVEPATHGALSASLRHEIALPGYQGADLHVHTQHSEDAQERGGVHARDLSAEGVELAVATDHNHIGQFDDGMGGVAGAELTTWDPEVGHFNAFPIERLPKHRGTNPQTLLSELRRDPRTFVQINHPRLEDHISYFVLGELEQGRFRKPEFDVEADGLEVYNGYDLARPSAVLGLLREWRALLAKGKRLTATGGSDSHGPRGHYPGYPRTYVHARQGAELAPELKRGRAFVSNGPLIELRVHGKGPGDAILTGADKPLWVEVSVLAPSFMHVARAELWLGEKRIWSSAIAAQPEGQPLRFVRHVRVYPGQARTLHAVAEGGTGLDALVGRSDVTPLAFTNPIYLVPHAEGQRAER